MTLNDVYLISQIIAVLLVAPTLLYLALQIRQGAEQLRSETRQTQLENDQVGVYKFVEFPELGRIASQTETPSFEEKTKLVFWMIGQMRAREYEWLQYKSGAMTKEAWETYRGVIYFVLGTARNRALWELCKSYFNAEFVASVNDMMCDVPQIEFWEQLEKTG
ncbi:hypothetical protein PUV54_03090 [Hyphococcus flavus]|uniref:DUF4760 domain-containing protein n=1 Tax=Hyphococcus flavus TaxID=1866326 RepID=A0AAE9ZCV5_9PROT|nr:hypothetical protein [Hyphococcus flavus]WDI32176.1 hypothetical protein PUV54_03090 [Hyphococcus flavus]